MKTYFLILILLINYLFSLGQSDKTVVIRKLDSVNQDLKNDFIREIKIRRTSLENMPYGILKKQIIDSAVLYNGNFFHVKHLGIKELIISRKEKIRYLVIGDLYNLSESQLEKKSYKPKKIKASEYLATRERNQFETSAVFGIGGESKLAIFLPRFHLNNIHTFNKLNYYYGLGVGVHPHLIGGWGTIHIQTGIELKRLDMEASLSHLRATGFESNSNTRGPWRQTLANLKFGYLYNHNYRKLRLVISRVLKEQKPNNKEWVFFTDFGKFGNYIIGIELSIALVN